MNAKIFHYLSYTKWIFLIWGMLVAFPEFFNRTENLISNIGMGVFLCGISVGIGSLSDSSKLSKSNIRLFNKPKMLKMQSVFLLSIVFATLLTSTLFLLIPRINSDLEPTKAINYTNLGYGSLSLALGMLFELKQTNEKFKHFKSQQTNNKDITSNKTIEK